MNIVKNKEIVQETESNFVSDHTVVIKTETKTKTKTKPN